MSMGATSQGMLLCSHLVRICGDVVGPKYPLVSAINGRRMPKNSLDLVPHGEWGNP